MAIRSKSGFNGSQARANRGVGSELDLVIIIEGSARPFWPSRGPRLQRGCGMIHRHRHEGYSLHISSDPTLQPKTAHS